MRIEEIVVGMSDCLVSKRDELVVQLEHVEWYDLPLDPMFPDTSPGVTGERAGIRHDKVTQDTLPQFACLSHIKEFAGPCRLPKIDRVEAKEPALFVVLGAFCRFSHRELTDLECC